ncbi:MAG: TetR/AcrR family transcriptional regulator [Hyphomonadaceae bacterium]|nr:TetR/AcrR family transcriptional regulator [Hyphomonadaceae bacterium]
MADDASGRRQEILLVAADLFARRGYDGLGVRQIADAAGILGGSLYHHFDSKRDLYVEVHGAALAGAASLIREIAALSDPWERLEAACRVHLSVQVDPESVTLPMMSDLSAMSSDMRVDLVKDRDRFEAIYKPLIAALPLHAGIDRGINRLCLLSLINAVRTWYRNGGMDVDQIAKQIRLIFRASSGVAPTATRAKPDRAATRAAKKRVK